MSYDSNVAQRRPEGFVPAADSLLRTKLFMPPIRARQVGRPRLIQDLNAGLDKALILVSAPAGFGKTTAVAEWAAGCPQPVAWLSLDDADSDPIRFLTYFITALQTIRPGAGSRVLGALVGPRPPAIEWALTGLLNEITAIDGSFVIVLDDYHCIDSPAVDEALAYMLEHQPACMHLVLATREDPRLPLSKLRTRGQLTELRLNELRFTPQEAAEFLNRLMGLQLSVEDIDALEARTEGWIAGLQLAAISMQQAQDPTGFIHSFTGSHRFVLDYLVEEVLGRQPEDIQTFLLRTCILDRLCAPLCQVMLPADSDPAQGTLEHLERANLFIIPLDNERHWFRYHNLFADLLRQRLQQSGMQEADLHARASAWYEGNDLEIEAFQHAAAAHNAERALRLLEGDGAPLYLRGGLTPALKWLDSLPGEVLDARPKLWVMWASALLVAGQTTSVEAKLQKAETALEDAGLDQTTRDLRGQIAAARAMVAVGHYDVETIVQQASRALEHLHPDNLASRFRVHVALANAHEFRGEHAALAGAYAEALSIAYASGNILHIGVATIGLGQAQEYSNQLHPAAESYRSAMRLLGDQPPPILSYAYLGLARILYEWNDLASSEEHLQLGLQLARQYDREIDVFVICEVVLARLKLARGDVEGAAALLAESDKTARQRNFSLRLPEIAGARVLTLLHQGDLAGAGALAEAHELPMSRARVDLAQGDPGAALSTLRAYLQQAEARGWVDESLRVIALQAIALHADGQHENAAHLLHEVVALAEPGGFIRLFVDEGPRMAERLAEVAAHGTMAEYTGKVLAAFAAEKRASEEGVAAPPAQPLIEPLSERELEVLRLIAQGLSNHEISDRLFLALSTVKGHNRVIFNKLQVQRRTEAVARARDLGLL